MVMQTTEVLAPGKNLTPAHVGPIKAFSCIALRSIILASHAAAGFLGGCHLSLEGCSIAVDPLKLGKMAVEDADNVAQLMTVLTTRCRE
jgi:hypothetical protein